MKLIVNLFALFLFLFPTLGKANSGLIQIKSQYNLEETVKRFNARAVRNGMKIVYIISHDTEAEKVNKKLRPTRLIIFGSPKVSTALIQCRQIAGIDLPLRALVWQDPRGDVYVTYNNLKYLEARHELKLCQFPLDKIAANLKRLVIDATQEQNTRIR